MEEDIKLLNDYLEENDRKFVPEKRLKFLQAIENLINKYKEQEKHIEALDSVVIEHMGKYKEQEKIIELAIDELYLFNTYDCDYSDLKEHTCTKNDDDTVEIQKAKCKKCIREILEKKAKGE